MRRLVLSVLLAITVFILPSVSYSMDADLTPAQYKAGKSIVSKFCEARDDGLSLQSAIGTTGIVRKIFFAYSGDALKNIFDKAQDEEITQMTEEERDNVLDEWSKKYTEDLGAFILNKIQKDCPLNKQDLALAKSNLNELLLTLENS